MGNRNTDIRVNTLTDRVITNLKQLRDSSRSFFDQKLFTKNGDFWELPGKFKLRNSEHGVNVYKMNEYVDTFSNKRSATAWCILVYNQKREESRLLKHYDSKKTLLENNILVDKKRFSQCDSQDDKDIVSARLSDDYQKLNSSIKQIDKLINLAKYFQTRGFEHEAF